MLTDQLSIVHTELMHKNNLVANLKRLLTQAKLVRTFIAARRFLCMQARCANLILSVHLSVTRCQSCDGKLRDF